MVSKINLGPALMKLSLVGKTSQLNKLCQHKIRHIKEGSKDCAQNTERGFRKGNSFLKLRLQG